MKKIALLFLFLALILEATAQDKTIAELKKELAAHPQQDVDRVNKLIELTFKIFLPNEKKFKSNDEILSISQKIGYTFGEAYALCSIGFNKWILGNAKEGDSLLKRADYLTQKLNDPFLIAYVSFRIGFKAVKSGDKSGMELLFKAEKLFEISKRYDRLSRYCSIAKAAPV